MNLITGPAFRCFLWLALTFSAWVACCPGAVVEQNSGFDLLSRPKLCMPVNYRESPRVVAITTKIAMLGDRLNEVREALSGWIETGIPLVGKFNGRWEPVPCGDDTGLFYLVPLLARQTGWRADRSLDVFLMGVIALSAATGSVGLWLCMSRVRRRLVAIFPILAGAWLCYKMGDVYAIQGSVVLMLIPWLIYSLQTGLRSWRRFLITFLSGLTLGIAQWIRTQSASPILVFFAVLVCFSHLQRSLKVLLWTCLLAGMGLTLLYAQVQLHQRDEFLAIQRPSYRPSLNHHLFWHTAYLGLAYLTNPYVSAWRDSVAVDYVQTVDPAAIYGGKEYEEILRSKTLATVRRDPRFILYTLAAKCGVLSCMLLLTINVGLAAAISCPKSVGIELAFWLSIAFASLPGIIAIPLPQYVIGMIILALYYWYFSVSYYIERRAFTLPTIR
jgi:hypothetical protein